MAEWLRRGLYDPMGESSRGFESRRRYNFLPLLQKHFQLSKRTPDSKISATHLSHTSLRSFRHCRRTFRSSEPTKERKLRKTKDHLSNFRKIKDQFPEDKRLPSLSPWPRRARSAGLRQPRDGEGADWRRPLEGRVLIRSGRISVNQLFQTTL